MDGAGLFMAPCRRGNDRSVPRPNQVIQIPTERNAELFALLKSYVPQPETTAPEVFA